MKNTRLILSLLLSLLAVLSVGRQLVAQTSRILFNFGGVNNGANPAAGLVLSGNTLYGTAEEGGRANNGTVFAVQTDGTGFTNLYFFTATESSTNSDGTYPSAGLILSGDTLYGTAYQGGTNDAGTLFAIKTNGTGFTVLHIFTTVAAGSYTNSDGAEPDAGLILSGDTLYGTTSLGGSHGNGAVFSIKTNGSDFTNLYFFSSMVNGTNGDGALPLAGSILSGGTLYGTATDGGTNGEGTVFAVNTNGTRFTNIHNFAASTDVYHISNSEGENPEAGLLLSGNTLYGTAYAGGTNGAGTVFALNTDGSAFTTLHNFAGYPIDGLYPQAALILSGTTLYGTTTEGGDSDAGTVFSINTDGTGFTTLLNFTNNPDSGYWIVDTLILSSNTFYGTTQYGGTNDDGVVFSFTLGNISPPPPQLSINRSGNKLILTWPTIATGYTLQSTTNLVAPVWTTVAGQFAVTNAISGVRQFFRLSQ